MSDDAQRWKEKYLKSIEQQEKLERRWNARLDLLRRGLVRTSLAAEGSDRAVDQCMKEMREVVRKDDMDSGLAILIPRLEKAVLDSEQRREVRVSQIATAVSALVTQLQSLPLPREVSKPLKRFAKDLDDRVSQARELPLLLGELSGLQGQALTILENPEDASRPWFLQRLFGAREAADATAGKHPVETAPVAALADPEPGEPPQHPAPPPVAQPVEALQPAPQLVVDLVTPAAPFEVEAMSAPVVAIEPPAEPAVEEPSATTPEPAPAEVIEQAPTLEPVPEAETPEAETETEAVEASSDAEETDVEETEVDAEPDAESAYALPASPEPSYSSVAAHIEETLLGLLNDLTLPEHHRPQAEDMRTRLEHGLNWYELLPILDDLAVLMLAITDSGQHEFEAYLQQLNERLESFQANLQAAAEGHADNHSASRNLNSQLREQVDGLQNSFQGAADLNSLKHVLENRLEGLLSTMDRHQHAHDQREQEVAARLQGLASRVATMEQEAQGFRVHLAEQRQKALIDPLTGLPNRAAWGERLEQEVESWQKHKDHLLLAMLDLDQFKRINDGYGHLAGDKVLKIVATVLRKSLRAADFIARFGGEEFVILLPRTSMTDGLALLEKLRAAIERCPFHFKGEPVVITVSMGLTAFKPGERGDLVIKRADQALYRAKDEGRNRIEQA